MAYSCCRYAWPALILAFAAAGCGPSGPPVGQLYGKITYQGQPVTEGTVSIFSADASGVAGAAVPYGADASLGSDGSYRFQTGERGVLLGEYTVAILPPEELEPPNPRTPSAMVPKNVANIPKKYRSASTSGLTATVKEGNNEHDFEMK